MKLDDIRYIYHLADIHIRNTTDRLDEYRDVFEKLYKKLENEPSGLIIIAGDIVHNKIELSPECVQETSDFLKKLMTIMPVLLIPGNHDGCVENSDRLDALSPIVDLIKNDHLMYITTRSVIEFSNFSLGISSVFEQNDVVCAKELPTGKIKIGLFHGTVDKALINPTVRLKNNQTVIDDFEGYDIVMLGDVHRFQFMDENNTIAYAGSLIQQTHMETINEHGYIKWDLKKKIGKLIEINNAFGYCVLNIKNGELELPNDVPKKPRIVFKAYNTEKDKIFNIIKSLKKIFDIQHYTIEYIDDIKYNEDEPYKCDKVDSDNFYLKEFEYIVKDPTLVERYLSDIKTIEEQEVITYNWKPITLEFTNMFSYGKNNKIGFDKFKDVVGIVASNGYGKSAIIDVLLYCIYERCSRVNGKTTRDYVLREGQSDFECKLECKICDDTYCIRRTGKKTLKDHYVYSVDFWKINGQSKLMLNGQTMNDTNENIIKYFGSYDDAVSTFIMLQNDFNDFLHMKQKDRKDNLRRLFKLETFDKIYLSTKDTISKINLELKICKDKVDGLVLHDMKKDSKIMGKKIIKCSDICDELEVDNIELDTKIDTSMRKLITTKDIIIGDLAKTYNKLTIKISSHFSKLFELNKDIKIIEITKDIQNNHTIFLKDKETQVEKLTDELNKLSRQIAEIDVVDIESLIITKKTIKCQIKKLEELFDNVMRDINDQEKYLIDMSDDEHIELVRLLNTRNNLISDQTNTTIELEKLSNFGYDPNCKFCIKNNKKVIDHITDCKSRLDEIQEKIHKLIVPTNIEDKIKNYTKNKKIKEEISRLNKIKIKKDAELNELKEKLVKILELIKLHENDNEKLKKNLIIEKRIEIIKKQINSVLNQSDNEYDNLCKQKMKYDKLKIDNIKTTSELKSQIKELVEKQKQIYILMNSYYDNIFNKFKNIRTEIKIKKYKEIRQNNTQKINMYMSLKSRFEIMKIELDKKIVFVKDTTERINEMTEKNRINNIYVNAVGRDGVPKLIIEKLIPKIQNKINEIVKQLYDFSLNIVSNDDGINLYLSKNETKILLESASGSEKFVVNIALRTVLSHLCKMSKPNFIIIDEGFTSFDSDRRMSVKNIFDIIKQKTDFVMVISHLCELKSMLDHEYAITRKNITSKIIC